MVKVFDLTVASTGLNSRQLETLGLPFKSVTTHSNNHAEYYPGSASITLKLLYSPDGKIYGAQAVGAAGTEKRIDVIATAMRGDVPTLQWSDLADLDPEKWFFLDVRQPEELAIGKVPGAINIPLAELRARTAELPRDKKILVNCARGKRSYYALRALRQLGFDAWNLSGGYTTYHSATAPLPEPVSKVSPRPVQESIGSNKSVSKEVHSGQSYTLDACGLQCPGPILRLYNKVNSMQEGDEVTVTATDFGFASDVAAWARSTGNTLKALDTRDGKVIAVLRKGLESAEDAPAVPAADKKGLTMVVFSGDLDKAIAAFIIANGFASMGQKATLFFTFWGLNILRKDEPVAVKKTLIEKLFGWMMPRGAKKLTLSQMHMLGMGTGMIKDIMKKKNVDSLPVLIREAQANGVKLIACQMTMDLMGIHQEELIEGVEIGGVATMAASATESNTHYFI